MSKREKDILLASSDSPTEQLIGKRKVLEEYYGGRIFIELGNSIIYLDDELFCKGDNVIVTIRKV